MKIRLLDNRSVGTACVVLAGLCLSVSSCTSDEDVQPAGEKSQKAPLTFNVVTDDYNGNGTTRGTPSEDLEESMGMFAHTYPVADALYWDDGGGTAPNFMINEEVQYAGDKNNESNWATVNKFEEYPDDCYLRFYAYYPYGLPDSILSLTGAEHENAPVLTYSVPDAVEDQKDLMAGSSFVQDEYDPTVEHIKVYSTNQQNGIKVNNVPLVPEKVTIKMSHLLTAVGFRIGECKEAGRVKRITLTNILGTNDYSLQRMASDDDFEGWTVRNIEDHQERYRSFSFDLDKVITVSQRDGDDNAIPQPITGDDQWFLMLPHTLANESSHTATLLLVYNTGGSDHTMQVELGGRIWEQGKKVVYTLNIDNLQRMTVKSTIIPWGQGLIFVDGQPTNATILDIEHGITDWDLTKDEEIASDDPRD